MIAITLYTFNADKEVRKTDDIIRFGQSLFLTYNIISVLYLETDTLETIYSYSGPEKDYSHMPLRAATDDFIAGYVYKADIERFKQFMDYDSLEARIGETGGNFIQDMFRIKDRGKGFTWQNVRLTRMINNDVVCYLYTFQNVSKAEERVADYMLREHPEML
jgi:hypothetical protein